MSIIQFLILVLGVGYAYFETPITGIGPWPHAGITFVVLLLLIAVYNGPREPHQEVENDSQTGWQCQSCGAVMTTNQTECPDCGYTIFEKVRFTG